MTDWPIAACKVCFDLDEVAIHKKLDDTKSSYLLCLDTLAQSAKQCSTCVLILEACKHCHPEAAANPELYTVSFQASTKLSSKSLSLVVWPTEGVADMTHTTSRRVNFYAVLGKPCPWPLFRPWPGIPKDRHHLAEQILNWIGACERDHEDCRMLNAPTLPKRVVQIIPDTTGALAVRLVETKPHTESRYACLSHCWGKHQILRTVTDNILRLKTEIPWNSLSKTFQDAIEFSHLVGIEYIWIDSLCIIQDCGKDWENEAAKMAEYYANSHITLAATAAIDGTVGFFPKLPEYDEPLELQGVNHGQPYYIIAETEIHHPYDEQPDSAHISEFPLMTRGWVYQEQTLSRRYLHFCPREVVWECRSQTSCQCESEFEDTHWNLFRTNSSRSVMRRDVKMGGTMRQRELWYDNIMNMMDLEFTYLGDRLSATAGIVSELAESFKTRYLAGLWEDKFVTDSCWFMDEFSRRPEELKKIPSWSWASVTGGIDLTWCQRSLTDDTIKIASRVVHIDCEFEGPQYLGRLKKGLVTFAGPAVGATIEVCPNNGPAPSSEKLFTLKFDDTEGLVFNESSRSGWSFLADAPNFETNIRNDEQLRILKMMMGQLQRTGKDWAIFLVVQKVQGQDSDRWERVGLLFSNGVRRNEKAKNVCFLEWFDGVAQEQAIQIQ
nr:HET-domain containing protein [Trichoderma crystalligenum]